MERAATTATLIRLAGLLQVVAAVLRANAPRDYSDTLVEHSVYEDAMRDAAWLTRVAASSREVPFCLDQENICRVN
jgi:hypothetical protein